MSFFDQVQIFFPTGQMDSGRVCWLECHTGFLSQEKKKLETEMCIRSVLYIASEALRLIKQALSKTKMSSHRLSIFSKASCILYSPRGSDATVKDRKPLLCVATDPQNECPG